MKRLWKNAVEAAREALAAEDERPARSCVSCAHGLGDGTCAVSLELECRDGNYEAWEAKRCDGGKNPGDGEP